MSTPGGPPQCEGMYSKLIDFEGSYDQLSRRSEAGPAAHLVFPSSVAPRLRGFGTFRLATICLAVLSAILLIAIISMASHNKNRAQGGGDAVAEAQKQKQGVNVSELVDSISKLQQEKKQLQGEKEEQQRAKEELQKAKEGLQREKEELQKANKELQREKEELQKAKEGLQREKEELQKANKELQREKDELQARLAVTKAPVVTTPKSTSAPIVCPNDWHLFNSSCYFISRTTRDWPESKSFCESKGAYLAIIHTPEEQTFLWDLLPRGHWNSYWFGLTDGQVEDEWKWVDGTPLVGGFWEEGEPNNHIDEDCGYIVKTNVLERVATRSWYDAPCTMYLPFICEKYMGPGASTGIPH
ncbi:C-type lectin domain family 4 member M-like [Salarias fasciatus]|uniref:C-type lectin domain family 4 member M-like n=1 Tax=Salarias fasciatus TaxID=181472 RepID=A0A672H442_SALFA|nr:C-type lectin domain family 4 member M-like [Salarias fasciatus]